LAISRKNIDVCIVGGASVKNLTEEDVRTIHEAFRRGSEKKIEAKKGV